MTQPKELNKQICKELLNQLDIQGKQCHSFAELANETKLSYGALCNILYDARKFERCIALFQNHSKQIEALNSIFRYITSPKTETRANFIRNLIKAKNTPLQWFAFGRFAENFGLFLAILLEIAEDDLTEYEINTIYGILEEKYE